MGYRARYEKYGFVVAKGLLTESQIGGVRTVALRAIQSVCPQAADLQDPKWVAAGVADPGTVTEVYDMLQSNAECQKLGMSAEIVDIVHQIRGPSAMYSKVPFRLDAPGEVKEMAHWHQDHFYVRGNEDDVTVWVPIFRTRIEHGPLSVMPGSHKLGPLSHGDHYGKKSIPRDIYDREVRIVELEAGDALFFSALLMHSSNVNFSGEFRYSLQFRYTAPQSLLGPEMGPLLSLGGEQ